ncbi:MAG: cysteine desulfurase family protein [Coriobacteriia bacterium]|nr:cysteine desulfurase family protein [Coriobacteriia bacterium]
MAVGFGAEQARDYVYLDYAATTPLCQEAADAMAAYLVPGRVNLAANANANSLHSPGRAAFSALEQARRQISRDLGAKRAQEIVFTSGATEADDAAVLGMAQAAVDARRRAGSGDFVPRVIVSALEHDAVLKPAKRLEQQGFDVVRLQPNSRGFVTVEALEAALSPQTVLVSIQMANSELGSVQPVRELCRTAHQAGALFHTDATQALGKVPLSLQELEVDAASFSAHKICGPKGVGVLYLKARTPFAPYMLGGGQEAGLRSGTQNVMGAVAFAAAVHAAVESLEDESARLRRMRDDLYGRLAQMRGVRPTVQVEEGSVEYLPNIVHVLVKGVESETLILRLDKQGFGVSGGSACSSGSLDPSHVLTAMGVPTDAARGALRVSFGRYTTEDDLSAFCDALERCMRK